MTMFRMIPIGLTLLSLAGCTQARIAANCQREVGPMPYSGARVFGPLGDLVVAGTPEGQDWDRRIQECKARANAG